MHSVRLGMRFGFLAGTALALILTVSTTASAAPHNSKQMQPPQPAARDYSTPGSMPKPSTTMDDGIRFRGTLPVSSSAPTPLAPASNELRSEPEAKPATAAKPVTAPEPAVATYFYLRLQAVQWPPPGAYDGGLLLPTLALVVLLLSAVPMYRADHAVKEKDRPGVILYTSINVIMALVFLGMRAMEMHRLTFRWDSHAYGSIYWSLLGLHTSHVIASTVESIVLVVLIARGYFHDEQRLGLRTDGLYWYFVVAAWVPLYAILFLFPRWQ